MSIIVGTIEQHESGCLVANIDGVPTQKSLLLRDEDIERLNLKAGDKVYCRHGRLYERIHVTNRIGEW